MFGFGCGNGQVNGQAVPTSAGELAGLTSVFTTAGIPTSLMLGAYGVQLLLH